MALARRLLAGSLLVTAALTGAQPAQAQGLFDFLFSRPVARAPAYEPSYYPFAADFDRPAVRRHRPKVVRASSPPVKMPAKPKAPGEVANPVPELLADSTLQRGDIVVFPDGPRVFSGDHGARHSLGDFEPLSQAASLVPPSTRKLVGNLKPGANLAWSTEKPGVTGKVAAANTRDVDATGSVKPVRR
jgi:hypothetical protein